MNAFTYTLRHLLKYKWISVINAAGLSMGIASTIIIVLFVDYHLSTDRHHRDADRIYRAVLNIQTPDGRTEYEPGSSLPMSGAFAAEFSQVESTAFCMMFYIPPTLSVGSGVGVARYREDDVVAYADNGFLEMFDHVFVGGDKATALHNPRSVVLSERQARKYFGTTDAVGKLININHTADLVVTGVFTDHDERSDLRYEVLVSLPTLKVLNPNYQEQNFSWVGSNNWTFIKLKDRLSFDDATEALPAFGLKYLGPDLRHWHLQLQPLSSLHFDTRYDGTISKSIIWVLLGISVALTVVVSINYINLSVAQGHHRAREIGIRRYLGVSRTQLFLQFMLETVMVVLASVCLALASVYMVLPVVNSWLQTQLDPGQVIHWDRLPSILLFIAVLSLLAGYYPAVRLARFDPVKVLRGGGPQTGGGLGFRKALVTIQYAVALCFVIGTMVVIRQLDFLVNKDPGFSMEAILTVKVPKAPFEKRRTFRNEIAALPMVRAATLHNQPPMASSTDGGFVRYDNRSQWESFIVRDRWADDRFLDAYDISLVAGRNIIISDSVTEVLINETLLARLGVDDPNEALGRPIVFDNSALTGTIVGVVEDFHNRSLQHAIEPIAIYPFPAILNELGIRLSSYQGIETLAVVEKLWKNNFPDEVFQYAFLGEAIRKMYRTEQTTKKLTIVFSTVSVITCLIGIAGLLAFTSQQRTRELGIRKVLGATVGDIIVLLCRQYLFLFIVALAVSLPVSIFCATRWLSGFAYRIEPPWPVFAVPGMFMVLLTLLIMSGQSIKIAMASPTKSLRND